MKLTGSNNTNKHFTQWSQHAWIVGIDEMHSTLGQCFSIGKKNVQAKLHSTPIKLVTSLVLVQGIHYHRVHVIDVEFIVDCRNVISEDTQVLCNNQSGQ